jgi:hypothetical protein
MRRGWSARGLHERQGNARKRSMTHERGKREKERQCKTEERQAGKTEQGREQEGLGGHQKQTVDAGVGHVAVLDLGALSPRRRR